MWWQCRAGASGETVSLPRPPQSPVSLEMEELVSGFLGVLHRELLHMQPQPRGQGKRLALHPLRHRLKWPPISARRPGCGSPTPEKLLLLHLSAELRTQ